MQANKTQTKQQDIQTHTNTFLYDDHCYFDRLVLLSNALLPSTSRPTLQTTFEVDWGVCVCQYAVHRKPSSHKCPTLASQTFVCDSFIFLKMCMIRLNTQHLVFYGFGFCFICMACARGCFMHNNNDAHNIPYYVKTLANRTHRNTTIAHTKLCNICDSFICIADALGALACVCVCV